jgi:hypothetical protein
VILSQELNGASSLANCAKNRAGPLMFFMIFPFVRLNEAIDNIIEINPHF